MVLGIIDWFKRRAAADGPFPEEWRVILREHVPFYDGMGDELRERFEEKLKVFARTKEFVGAGGLELDETMKVVISAAAARLVANIPGEHYERLTEIVVYPSHYRHPGDDDKVVFGEAHTFGTVVLSWDAVRAGFSNERDGHNTAMHELAHVLDIEDGRFDGTPELHRFAAYAPWANVMSEAYLGLRAAKRKQVLRSYGATNEAEFFAVATEAFFEKPKQLRTRSPELYALLVEYYMTDPAAELDARHGEAR